MRGVLYGPQDAFIVKYDLTASPTLVYSTYLGGELRDTGRPSQSTPNGTVYVAGSTESTGFPQAGAQYRSSLAGFLDVWVAQMDLTKSSVDSLVYSTYLGGSDLDEVRRIAIDPTGKLLVAGYTMSPDFPVTGDAAQRTLGGNADAFVARLDFTRPQNGFVNYATYLGGAGGDVAYDVTSDSSGNIYVTGYTLSSNFPDYLRCDCKVLGWRHGCVRYEAEHIRRIGVLQLPGRDRAACWLRRGSQRTMARCTWAVLPVFRIFS